MRVLATWQPQWSKYYYINFCISMKSADVYFLQNILACLQCDHMTSLFINISPFKTVKNCPTGWKFAKVSSKFGQILNIPLVFTKLQKIGKSGYTARLLFQVFGSWYRTQAAIAMCDWYYFSIVSLWTHCPIWNTFKKNLYFDRLPTSERNVRIIKQQISVGLGVPWLHLSFIF